MNRRTFLSRTLSGLDALSSVAHASPPEASQAGVQEVLVMFKCHLDVGFVDTQAAIIHRYVDQFFPRAIDTAERLRATGGDSYVWTTGSWLLYEYLEQANAANAGRMERAIERG